MKLFDDREQWRAAADVAAMLLFVPLARVATFTALLLILLVGMQFSGAGNIGALAVWSVAALVIATANAIGAVGGMNHPTRAALLRYLVLSALALGSFWLIWPS